MSQRYEITLKGEPCGVALLEKNGLYYSIDGCFQAEVGGMFRLILNSGAGEIDLGICLKCDNGYELHTRIPAKNILPPISFHVRHHGEYKWQLYPIIPGEEFKYIEKLPLSRLVSEKGKIGIIIQE